MSDSTRLYVQLDRIEASIAEIRAHGGAVDKTLALQHQQLVEHIKRTALLEKEMLPISRHVQQVQGAGKLVALIAVIASIVTGIAVLWGH